MLLQVVSGFSWCFHNVTSSQNTAQTTSTDCNPPLDYACEVITDSTESYGQSTGPMYRCQAGSGAPLQSPVGSPSPGCGNTSSDKKLPGCFWAQFYSTGSKQQLSYSQDPSSWSRTGSPSSAPSKINTVLSSLSPTLSPKSAHIQAKLPGLSLFPVGFPLGEFLTLQSHFWHGNAFELIGDLEGLYAVWQVQDANILCVCSKSTSILALLARDSRLKAWTLQSTADWMAFPLSHQTQLFAWAMDLSWRSQMMWALANGNSPRNLSHVLGSLQHLSPFLSTVWPNWTDKIAPKCKLASACLTLNQFSDWVSWPCCAEICWWLHFQLQVLIVYDAKNGSILAGPTDFQHFFGVYGPPLNGLSDSFCKLEVPGHKNHLQCWTCTLVRTKTACWAIACTAVHILSDWCGYIGMDLLPKLVFAGLYDAADSKRFYVSMSYFSCRTTACLNRGPIPIFSYLLLGVSKTSDPRDGFLGPYFVATDGINPDTNEVSNLLHCSCKTT